MTAGSVGGGGVAENFLSDVAVAATEPSREGERELRTSHEEYRSDMRNIKTWLKTKITVYQS